MRRPEELDRLGVDVDGIVDAVEDSPVDVCVLYGSVPRDDTHDRSDVDLAVIFDGSLSPNERTQARLSLVDRVSTQLGTDDVDVVPMSGAPVELLDDVRRDGILLVGSLEQFESRTRSVPGEAEQSASIERLDRLLADIERVV